MESIMEGILGIIFIVGFFTVAVGLVKAETNYKERKEYKTRQDYLHCKELNDNHDWDEFKKCNCSRFNWDYYTIEDRRSDYDY